MTSHRSDLVDIACRVVRQSEKAVGVQDGTPDKERKGALQIFWLPRSQIEINDDGTITMPEWLAHEKGLI